VKSCPSTFITTIDRNAFTKILFYTPKIPQRGSGKELWSGLESQLLLSTTSTHSHPQITHVTPHNTTSQKTYSTHTTKHTHPITHTSHTTNNTHTSHTQQTSHITYLVRQNVHPPLNFLNKEI
jgi:hypothetical protein